MSGGYQIALYLVETEIQVSILTYLFTYVLEESKLCCARNKKESWFYNWATRTKKARMWTKKLFEL